MRVFIAGAGYVGFEVAKLLAEQKIDVTIGQRSHRTLPAFIQGAPFHLEDEAMSLPDGTTHIVFAAAPDASSKGNSPDDALAAYERVYVQGMRNILAAVQRQRLPIVRIVFTSSTAVYASSDGERVDESTPTTGHPPKATATKLLEAEALTLAHPQGIVLRLAGIYGPGRNRLIRMVKEGSARCSHPAPIGNRIHRDDCAGALVHLLTLPAPERIYVGVDHAPVELCEVYRWLAQELGVEPPRESSEPDERGRGARKVCSNERLVRSGYGFRFPTYREGYAPLLHA